MDYLRAGDTIHAQHCLSTLSFSLHAAGALAAAQRCADLQAAISHRTGRSDGSLHLARARLAAARGETWQARALIKRARNGRVPEGFRWFTENLDYLQLYLALETKRSLISRKLAKAGDGTHSRQFMRDLAGLRAELCLRQGNLNEALTAALEHDQLCRNAGLDVAPARVALVFARLGRISEATAAAEDAASRLNRLHPAQRPHYHLASAFQELGERAQAGLQARDAYQQAWADGPPYRYRWDLARARHLLRSMNEPAPKQPAPTRVAIPHEDEICDLISAL